MQRITFLNSGNNINKLIKIIIITVYAKTVFFSSEINVMFLTVKLLSKRNRVCIIVIE